MLKTTYANKFSFLIGSWELHLWGEKKNKEPGKTNPSPLINLGMFYGGAGISGTLGSDKMAFPPPQGNILICEDLDYRVPRVVVLVLFLKALFERELTSE